MANETKPEKAEKPKADKRVEDAIDFAGLFETSSVMGDITETHLHEVPIGKPRGYFRTHPNKIYRQHTEIYVHKVEGVIETSHFILAPPFRKRLEEARPCVLVTVVDREGNPRMWPIPYPREGDRDSEAWKSARAAAGQGIKKWVKLLWANRSYRTREALPGYAPDPDFDKLPSFPELVKLAFGESGVINSEDHHMWRELVGAAPGKQRADEDDGNSI